MRKQLYYQEIKVGSEIPPLTKRPSACQLIMWAGASGDLNPIHWDDGYARQRGLPGIVVHGQLAGCFLGQMVTDWMGPQGRLKKLTINYRGLNLPNDVLTCSGVVTRKYLENGYCYVVAKLAAENSKGEQTVGGTTTVVLPLREA
jgi:acyl dehydratase